MANLYDTDYLIWTEKQAELLRDRKFEQLDLENLIEEVEDLGKSELRTCRSGAILIIIHLLYLRYWEAELERNQFQWQAEIDNWRVQLESRLTGSFRNRLEEEWEELYQSAVKKFEKKTGLNIPKS
ncbi:protein of unknown function DUF29 [Gloeothece citriformis PCC 7424]|uniref:DUF29 domain-containing protein n=1 Tax=Gloeothece citriformis (strain PCC 7424) TaxID=65393 RepID=B7KEG4_GLOC7|nr:DUF29 domain-containing protein [Gloeothece citriformis]ACK73282.1 protein of unknown function DUF29 [Gloeothece citriformis PCC 7424]